MSDDDPAVGGPGADAADGLDGPRPRAERIPTPAAVCDAPDPTGYVVWHRKHLRVDDHRALSTAVADGDAICPLFVFDPSFYGGDGLACDARIRFLEEAVASLDRLYAATPTPEHRVALPESVGDATGNRGADGVRGADAAATPETLRRSPTPGLTVGHGDPVALLSRFVDRGWEVITMATPTSRYGRRRDERVREACGDAVAFVSGDGLVRGEEWPRSDWQSAVREWLSAPLRTPDWGDAPPVRVTVDTGVTPASVDARYGIDPTKTKVPTGTHRDATATLREFTERIASYPGNISAPQDARGGTSGLSPYLNFGLLSVRQAHRHVTENAPSCRGREMFTSRLVWNLHYNQKLVDWPGWADRAVNPAFEGWNEATHDPDLVAAWKEGRTGFPMVDASMRCLRETGWLNFRMRAMCASFFAHILKQPWWIGADWYHHHLIDSDVGINYTQWQSQAGLVGKPSQRVYNPRKQVRDQDPDGEWIAEWVPELDPLPSAFLDRPERAPLAVQRDCGVVIGETYPRPVVDFERERERFWTRYERRRPEAARELRRPEIAKRASFSGGYEAARAIADKHGAADEAAPDGTQLSLADLGAEASTGADGEAAGHGSRSAATAATDGVAAEGDGDAPAVGGDDPAVPTGAGARAGEPSPDDRAALGAGGNAREDATGNGGGPNATDGDGESARPSDDDREGTATGDPPDPDRQTRVQDFE